MKKLFITSIVMIAISNLVLAQSADPSVIASAGNSYEGTSFQVSWTLGETVIATISDGNTIITQGFQQDTYEVIGLSEPLSSPEFSVKVFPNPTEQLIFCEIKNKEDIGSVKFTLLGVKGEVIDNKEFADVAVKDFTAKFNLQAAPAGEYFLNVLVKGEKQSFKIIKK